MNDETRCSVVRDLLPGYIDNLTSEQTNAFVKAHLAACAECRAVPACTPTRSERSGCSKT